MIDEDFLGNYLPDNDDRSSIFNDEYEYTKEFFQQTYSESTYFKDTCENDLNDEEQTNPSIKKDLTEINKNNLTNVHNYRFKDITFR